jgi:hypothetical protein
VSTVFEGPSGTQFDWSGSINGTLYISKRGKAGVSIPVTDVLYAVSEIMALESRRLSEAIALLQKEYRAEPSTPSPHEEGTT